MHDKGQKVEPFGIWLYLELLVFPGEFDVTGTKFAVRIKIAPGSVSIDTAGHEGHNGFSSVKIFELSIWYNWNFLTVWW